MVIYKYKYIYIYISMRSKPFNYFTSLLVY